MLEKLLSREAVVAHGEQAVAEFGHLLHPIAPARPVPARL
jgi:hypothetical protein